MSMAHCGVRTRFSGIACLVLAGVSQTVALAQTGESAALRQEIEQLRTQVKTLQTDVDAIKAQFSEQKARANPVFDISGDPGIGDKNAKLVIIEFSDFECPFCLEYFKTIYRQVIDSYVKTGKVRYVFSDYPGEKIHPHAFQAAQAGRCANEQGKFWEFHDQLFPRQRDLGSTGVVDASRAAGLNEAQFNACVASGKFADAIRRQEEAAAQLGMQGTPAFVFGTPDPSDPSKVKLGRALVGAQPLAAFQQSIESLLPK